MVVALASSSDLIFANCSLCRPPPITTTNPLAAAGPSTGISSLSFPFSPISTQPAAAMLRSSLIRASRSSAAVMPSVATRTALPRAAPAVCQLQQARQAHAISNPTLANIEKRWEDMPPQEQADLWMSLRDRMKVDWKEMTLQEKKAGTYSCRRWIVHCAVSHDVAVLVGVSAGPMRHIRSNHKPRKGHR